LTVLITSGQQGVFLNVIYILTALTVFNLVVVSVVGAVLRVAYEEVERTIALKKIEVFWGLASIMGIILFLGTVALLSFLAGIVPGIVCSVFALLSAVIIFTLWEKIGKAWENATERR
jgi:hypothetical protein